MRLESASGVWLLSRSHTHTHTEDCWTGLHVRFPARYHKGKCTAWVSLSYKQHPPSPTHFLWGPLQQSGQLFLLLFRLFLLSSCILSSQLLLLLKQTLQDSVVMLLRLYALKNFLVLLLLLLLFKGRGACDYPHLGLFSGLKHPASCCFALMTGLFVHLEMNQPASSKPVSAHFPRK